MLRQIDLGNYFPITSGKFVEILVIASAFFKMIRTLQGP